MKSIFKTNVILIAFVLVIASGIAMYHFQDTTGAVILDGGLGSGITTPITLDPLDPVNNLRVTASTKDSVTVAFTIPCNGDLDGKVICENGVISNFQIRYGINGPISNSNILGTSVGSKYCESGICAAINEGVAVTRTISGLKAGTNYWFAVKYTHTTRGDAVFSNSPSGTTLSACVPSPELCDNKDNNCNGQVDEEIIQACPLQLGVCAGTQQSCSAGLFTSCNYANGNVGYEAGKETSCNDGKDNDCDGVADAADLDCGGSGTGATAEVCDGLDNDQDGFVDEGFDKTTDVNNCGTCGNVCNFPNADTYVCDLGTCAYQSCEAGFYDNDNDATTGCEYQCTITNSGTEITDGLDNDCDGTVDSGLDIGTDDTGGDIPPSQAPETSAPSEPQNDFPGGSDAETDQIGTPDSSPEEQSFDPQFLNLVGDEESFVDKVSEQAVPITLALLIVGIILGAAFFMFRKPKTPIEQPTTQTMPTQPRQTGTMTQLDSYVQSALNKGYTEDQLRKLLLDAGWDSNTLEMSFKKFRSRFGGR